MTSRGRNARARLIVLAVLAASCRRERDGGSSAGSNANATWVGAAACAECHAAATNAWRTSDHAHALETANATSVLGDFAAPPFEADGAKTTFSREGDAFHVEATGPDGAPHDYPIAWTFGVRPLQQYLVELEPGRFQALGVAWDSRPREVGGGRWFSLHPGERIDEHDVLHWTGPAQNWNHVCADCHSTNLKKTWRAESSRLETSYSDLNVACEACHGPGSEHVAWAQREDAGDSSHGLAIHLARPTEDWAFPPGEAIARRKRPDDPLRSDVELEACGRCHSRRAQIWDELRPGEPLAQAFRVALLDDDLYEADGQIREEDYEYGSFLQSRMHAEGVTCSNCHDPHTLKLRAEGNLLCAQCHLHAKYDGPQHHFHTAESAAAQCVACHMPHRTYMVVDERRDHGFRIPRPDLSAKLGTPNACNDCHRDRSAAWAAEAVARWYGPQRKSTGWHWAEAIAAGRSGKLDAEKQLVRALDGPKTPAIVRATALELLARYLSPQSLPALERGARDPDPLVRRAAAAALVALEPATRSELGFPLLGDPMRTVRLEALTSLIDVPREALDPVQRKALDGVLAEYRRVQALDGDRAEAHANLGALAAELGDPKTAEAEFRTAMRLSPRFVPARVQLADLLGRNGREKEGEQLLRETIALEPQVADAHHALGLALVRQKRNDEALVELGRAATLAPQEARNAYVLGVALHDGGQPERAIAVLKDAHDRHPAEREVLSTLLAYMLERQDGDAALRYARELAELAPWDESARQLVERLDAARR